MLIEFTVGNFRSFKDPVTLSLVAASRVSKDKTLDTENVIPVDEDLRLLTSAAVYGANASGKSNLIAAFRFVQKFVLNSSREGQAEDKIEVERFRLSTETEGQPSYFEIVFLLDGKKYRYGFEVTPERVIAEWLFFVPTSKEARLFGRKMDAIKIAQRAFKEGRGIEERTRPNALYLSVVAQFNGAISMKILEWFRQFNVNLGIDDNRDVRSAIEMRMLEWFRQPNANLSIDDNRVMLSANEQFQQAKDQEAILRFVKDMDLGINNIHSQQVLNYALKEVTEIKTVHQKYNSQGNIVGSVIFDLDDQESAGTQRLFALALPILDALNGGHPLVIDELDARLHPLITQAIIGLFNSKKTNPNNAQLIFTTHDTNLLSNKLFRRDQIWFVEKDKFGASHLYSLAEFRVRNDASFEQNYIEGRYGAIPFIRNDLQLVVAGEHDQA